MKKSSNSDSLESTLNSVSKLASYNMVLQVSTFCHRFFFCFSVMFGSYWVKHTYMIDKFETSVSQYKKFYPFICDV